MGFYHLPIAYSLLESDRYQTRHSRSLKTSSQNLRSLSNEKAISPKSKKTDRLHNYKKQQAIAFSETSEV
ncbi:hypothetical protein [Pseudanabaena sp. UWO310]|uniref:hypothetical protein n=1 Tax=Pseudanabaena sp. UWO310 TaxID=2480795 RepID=UPI00168112D3|nr:hypothetical protein [Pseudanabaena sp. UWO310]